MIHMLIPREYPEEFNFMIILLVNIYEIVSRKEIWLFQHTRSTKIYRLSLYFFLISMHVRIEMSSSGNSYFIFIFAYAHYVFQ